MAIVKSLFAQMIACSKNCFGSTTILSIRDSPREIVVFLERLSKALRFPSDLFSSEEKDRKLYIHFVDYKEEPSRKEAVLNLKVAFVEILRFLQISHETTDSKDTYIVNLPKSNKPN